MKKNLQCRPISNNSLIPVSFHLHPGVNVCFQEEVYTVSEDDGSISVCVEFSGALEISDPIAVLVKTKDVSAEGSNLLLLYYNYYPTICT